MYDAIVIGSGLGGLTAGAKLAREGKKILLIERHGLLGGFASSFRRKGSRMEVALHEMDGLDPDDPKMKIFQELGVFDHVTFLPLPSFYRFRGNGKDFTLPHNPENAAKLLEKEFPDEKEAIAGYFATIISLSDEIRRFAQVKGGVASLGAEFPKKFPGIVKFATISVGVFLDELTENETLKLALAGNIGYYHDDPYELNMYIYAVAQSSFYKGGGHFIQGGSQELSDYLGRFIQEHGGEICINHEVQEIIIENDQATGVRYCQITPKQGDIQEARAPLIVANAALPIVIDKMLPPEVAKPLKETWGNWQPGPSASSLYLWFKTPPKSLGNQTYNTVLMAPSGGTLKGLVGNTYSSDARKRLMIFTDYSMVDSRLAKEGKGVGVVTFLDKLKDWEGLSDEEYASRKAQVTEGVLAQLEGLIPGIVDQIELTELATPKTIVHYTANPQGSIYGYAQTLNQSVPTRPPHKTPVPGLFLASAWSRPGGGFSGAIMSGYNCARAILTEKQ